VPYPILSVGFFTFQIYKLELEQKRLEEDAFVYNWLQQQFKLSPAYNKVIYHKALHIINVTFSTI